MAARFLEEDRLMYGWLPWKQAYGGWTRAVRYADGRVYRLGKDNTIYGVSERLARRFKTEVPAHPAKAQIEGMK
jgi:hypothetical protein